MVKELIKGNEAIIKAALLAGCDSFYGYPITPASEIAQAAALYFPKVGKTFVQAESEVASINMLYGASSIGERTLTASSGPGYSLMQEGVSYLAGAELPAVIVDIMRSGPGLGNIAPEQSDYFQVIKGGGHGSYRLITFAPNSVQEMADLTQRLFEKTDQYRNPGVLLADGLIGQMMESVKFKIPEVKKEHKPWAVLGDGSVNSNFITSIFLDPDDMEAHMKKLLTKYQTIEKNEVLYEEYFVEDAEILLVGFGIVSRLLYTVVDQLRSSGIKAGLFRPISLWPFPTSRMTEITNSMKQIVVVELSTGMMIEDVQIAVNNDIPIHLIHRFGGNLPSVQDIIQKIYDWK